mgnify:CR=1 FL=1
MLLRSSKNLQAAIAILCALLAAACAFGLTEFLSNADIPRAMVITLCSIAGMLSAFTAISLWRFSYPVDDDDWSNEEPNDLEHDFARVRFTGRARPGGSHDHLRVVARDEKDDG